MFRRTGAVKRGERGPPCSTHSSQLSSSTSAAGLVSGPSDAGDVGRVLTHPGDVLVTSVGSRSKTIHLQISPRRCPVPGQVYKGSWLRSACSKTSFAVRVVEGRSPTTRATGLWSRALLVAHCLSPFSPPPAVRWKKIMCHL